jgi:hypothetical protein
VAVSLVAAAMALYVQIFEVRAREEESRLAALRLESALAESRSRLKAEILAELRAEGVGGSSTAGRRDAAVPGTVLRRPELDAAGGDAPGLGLEPTLPTPPLTLSGLARGLESLSQRTREADASLRRDLVELRASTRRELDAAEKASVLTLVALIPLAACLLFPGEPETREEPPASSATSRPEK